MFNLRPLGGSVTTYNFIELINIRKQHKDIFLGFNIRRDVSIK